MQATEKQQRSKRSTHPGVKIVAKHRRHRVTHYARFIDPDTGKLKELNLQKMGLTNAVARREWCKIKAKSLMLRHAAIASGAPLITNTPVADVIKDYHSYLLGEGLCESTLRGYHEVTRQILMWCSSSGIEFMERIDQPRLEQFRKFLVARGRKIPARGRQIGRGKRVDSEDRPSPYTINSRLSRVRTVLNQLRREGRLPRLNSDLIADSLRNVRTKSVVPRFLHKPEIRRLLEAVERHDLATFKLTRAEHDGQGKPGSTKKYVPIKSFLLAALLTGCRFNELATLRWEDVNFGAAEMLLSLQGSKTGERRVPLDITPRLLELLVEMYRNRAARPYVFGGAAPFPRDLAETARMRLMDAYDAPRFTWHDLRRTCGTFLTCAPGIYGGASAFMSAKRLGHSVLVAEKHYVGAVTAVDRTATTLEAAMGIEDLVNSRLTGTSSLFAG